MLKKIFLILAILTVLVAGVLFTINRILLPVQAKAMVIKAAQEALSRKVTLDSLQYHLLSGFVLDNLTIYSKEDPEEVFAHVDQASAQVFFPGLINKKIILTSVRLVNLSARVVRFNAETWNFSDLLTPKPGAPAPQPMDIVISGLSISNARIKLVDFVGGDGFTEMIEPVNITGSLSLPAGAHLKGDIHIPSTNGLAVVNVRLGIKNNTVKANIELNNILAHKYLRFIPAGVQVPLQTLTVNDLKATVVSEKDTVTVAGSMSLNNINAEPVTGMKARGSLGLDRLLLTIQKDTADLKATINLKDSAIEMPDGKKFKASLKAPETRLMLKGNHWSLAANLTVTRFSAELPGAAITAAGLVSGLAIGSNEGTIDLKARPLLNTLKISLPATTAGAQAMIFTGTAAGSVHAVVPANGQAPAYNGTLELADGAFSGLPLVDELTAIRASLDIKTDEALIKDMSFPLLGVLVTASGTVRGFSNPELDLKAAAKNIDLALVEKIIPQIIKDNELLVKGQADVSAEIKGQAAELATKGIKAVATLKNAAVESAKLKQSLKDISGTVIYNAPDLSWKDLTMTFQDKAYTLNGRLQDFVDPLITASLKTEDITASAQVKKTGDGFAVEKLTATWFDSSISANGKIFLPPGAAPVIDITATGKALLKDIPKMMPQYAPQVEGLKLAGTLKIGAHVKGNPADWQRLNSTARIETPVLSVMGYTIENITIDANQRDGAVQPLEIKGRLYGGSFDVIGSVDLVKPNFPFESTFQLDRTSLELLKRDTPLKSQQLSGLLSGNGTMKGDATGLASLSGKTMVQITEGYLWDLEILSKILSIMSSSFQGGNVIITDASATLIINEGKIETNDLTLKSATVSLLGEGSLNMLDQGIDFNVTPRMQPQAPSGTGSDLLSAMNPTEGLLNIHISGTLSKPKFEHNLSAPNMIKKTLQNTVGGLLKLFE